MAKFITAIFSEDADPFGVVKRAYQSIFEKGCFDAVRRGEARHGMASARQGL
jgi:hypothetical protein